MMTYDDSQLMKLFEELSPKNRKKALKGAMTKAGTKVRRAAIRNLRSKMAGSNKNLEKGLRRVVYRKQLGFRVTIGSKKKSKRARINRVLASDDIFYLNSRGEYKPVLIWAEGGTPKRNTVTESSWRGSQRKRKGHPTGAMPRYGFLETTKQQMKPEIDGLLKDEIVKNIQRIARKYGCRVN